MIDGPSVAVVLAGGDAVSLDTVEDIPSEAYIIAADSGLDQADRLNLVVDLIVGDLDSVSASALANSQGIPIEQYPTDKNYTDLELALNTAARLEVDRVLVLGGHGGRVDHFFTNAAVITAPALSKCNVEWIAGDTHVYVVRKWTQVHGTTGQEVTLLAVGGPAQGVVTAGLKWPLNGDTLEPWEGRGLSNQLTAPIATIEVRHGTLLAMVAS